MACTEEYSMKKQISILLLCAMLLAGCAAERQTDGGGDTGPADNGTGTESVADTEASVYDDLVTEDFGGYTFHMLNGVSNYAYVLLTAEELTGETINDAVYNRNSLVADRLNVNLEEYIADWGETTPTVDALILAGDNAYDIFFDESQFSMQYVAKGSTTDLRTTEMQLDKPWWDAGSIETLSLGDRLYTVNGDLHLMYGESAWVFYVNKQMLADHNLASPYTLVQEGTWTMDKAGEMIRAVAMDVNGDGKMTTDDRFGLATHGDVSLALLIGSGQSLLTKNADNMPQWSPLSEEVYNISAKTHEIFFDTKVVFMDGMTPKGKNTAAVVNSPIIDHFSAGNSLFLREVLGHAKILRGMDNDFGILPVPKYAEGADYTTFVARSAQVLMIPVTTGPEALHRTAVILDNLGAESFRTVRQAYYDVQLNGKTIRDEESRDMLEVIFENRRYEMAYLFGLNDLGAAYLTATSNGSDISSAVAKIEDKCKAALADTLSALGE